MSAPSQPGASRDRGGVQANAYRIEGQQPERTRPAASNLWHRDRPISSFTHHGPNPATSRGWSASVMASGAVLT
jgi:hypothetical protein